MSLKEVCKKTKCVNSLGISLSAGEIGKIGENAAVLFLKHARSFSILDTNARSRRGEVDIICEKEGVLHFVEVKSTLIKPDSHLDSSKSPYFRNLDEVSNADFDAYDPIFRVNARKISRIKKAAAYYMRKHNIYDREVCFDLVTVYLFEERRFCRVSYHSNVFV